MVSMDSKHLRTFHHWVKVVKSKTTSLFCLQPQLANLCAASSRGRPPSCHRALAQQEALLQQETEGSELHFHPQPQENSQLSGDGDLPAARSGEDGSRSSTDSPSAGSSGDPGETTSTAALFLSRFGCVLWQQICLTGPCHEIMMIMG